MNESQDIKRTDVLFDKIAELIEQARKRVATTVNIAEVYTKYHIGRYIVEDEQQGPPKAFYVRRGKLLCESCTVFLVEGIKGTKGGVVL